MQSTILDGLESEIIYFLENLVSDLLDEGIKQLSLSIQVFNQFLQKIKILNIDIKNETIQEASVEYLIKLNTGKNNKVNKIVLSAKKSLALTSNLTNFYI